MREARRSAGHPWPLAFAAAGHDDVSGGPDLVAFAS